MARGSHATWGAYDSRVCCICKKPIALARGAAWLIVTSIVDDPTYLNQPFVTSTHFKRQADASGWNPTPCAVR